MSPATSRKHANHVVAGLKAAIHNPRVSDKAKERAKERLENMGVGVEFDEEHQKRVLAGYKAALHNENVSDDAKENARQKLQAAGVIEDSEGDQLEDDQPPRDEHRNHVLGGYKAALANPNVSTEAKLHAATVLDEHNAL
ncbi:hypothetical protein E1B28_013253 [Marasmius oreades]|uniref:Conidiation-specific protein 6 n=1 Tax=Marasmius oreades TaxID=181124 RepID=A0A9P7UMU0_9AGAR|nr:uncharacterized protein E1B28_013253 [Marasmius oreades]KAG7087275.1 hypothetical protein E1B28_013253 [Marasmius oreades]